MKKQTVLKSHLGTITINSVWSDNVAMEVDTDYDAMVMDDYLVELLSYAVLEGYYEPEYVVCLDFDGYWVWADSADAGTGGRVTFTREDII